MQRKTGILGILIAIVIIGIGYAVISSVPLIINGTGSITADQSSFDVKYTACEQTAGTSGITASCSANNVTTATFSVSGLKKVGDYVTFSFTITNNSDDLSAQLTKDSTYITNDNSTYFEVTETTFANTTLVASGTTTQVVTVRVIKTPISADESGNFTLTLSAAPVNP